MIDVYRAVKTSQLCVQVDIIIPKHVTERFCMTVFCTCGMDMDLYLVSVNNIL